MNNEIPTPRTDKAAFAIAGMSGDTGFNAPPKDFCKSSFARTLERELAAMTAQRDALREVGDGLAEAIVHKIWASSPSCVCPDCQALAAWSKLTK